MLRHLSSIALAGLALAISGCTGTPDPTPTTAPSEATPSAHGFACEPSAFEVSWSDVSSTDTVTGAVMATVKADKTFTQQNVVAENKIEPTVSGFPGAQAWLEDLIADLGDKKSISGMTVANPRLPKIDELLGGNLKVTGKHIGYIGVQHITASFTIACSQGDKAQASGHLETWALTTQGVLTCGVKPDPKSFAALVQQHCND